jgi:predicted AAA+ superfamily ATPase
VQRDVRQLIQVKDLRTFRNFVRLCAGRIGQLFNASDIGNNLGVSGHTIKSWISVLEASQILHLMEPYHSNIGKRLIKSPKIYFHDVGFAAYLLGFTSAGQICPDRLRGPLFENLVVSELLKAAYNRNHEGRMCFYRDKQQHEIDVLLAVGRRFDSVEIKSSATFHKDFLRELNYFTTLEPEKSRNRYLVYAGATAPAVQGVRLLNYRDARIAVPS